ncbi:MAG: hypothetical protein AB1638_11905, partial [Nitrospirota bacterium]
MKRNRINRLDLLVLSAIILIGVVHLPYPFVGDQALFTIGASKISHGEILYRDFWDIKQPGIYGFYLIAGALFGFNEIGVRMFELLYMVAFSVILTFTLKNYFKNPLVGSLVPLLTIGIYYGVSEIWHLTQVESLIGLPMFLSLWFAFEYSRNGGSMRLFLSGFMGGIVLLFKLIFLPILISFWFMIFIDAIVPKKKKLAGAFVQINAPVIIGILLPLLIMLGYFAWHDTLTLLYKTFFEYPPRILKELPAPEIDRLIQGLRWFIQKFAPVLALGIIGACVSLNNHEKLLSKGLILWAVVGFIVIIIQQFWWQYHYLLLFVPLGILACKGLDFLWSAIINVRRPSVGLRIAVLFSLALLFLPFLGNLAKKGIYLAHDSFALRKEKRLLYQSRFNKNYPKILSEVAFLSQPGNLPGNIYVFGDPLFLFLSGRNQAIAIHGWALEFFLPDQWDFLTDQLTRAFPPYIFVSKEYLNLIPNRSPRT